MTSRGWVILTDDYPPTVGGIATFTRWAAEALAARGPVRVYCRGTSPRTFTEGISVHPVRARSFSRRGAAALAGEAFLEARHAEGVLCTTWTVARVISRLLPVHVVAHGSDVVRPKRPADLQRVWRRCAHPWAVSAHLQGVLASRGLTSRVLPIPAPIQRPTRGGARWVMVARALEGKGGDRFVRLVAAAGVEGDVVGEGPALASWKRLAERLGARITFHGALPPDEVAAVYAGAAAVFLLSRRTLSEGLGLTLHEARSRGLPVVGTSSGGIEEALGEAGLLLRWTTPAEAATTVLMWLKGSPPTTPTASRASFLSALGADR